MSELLDTEPNHRWAIPQSWSWTIASQVAQIIGGGTPSTKESENFEDGEIPWITPADLTGYREKMIRRGERNITEKGLRDSGAKLMPAGTVLFSSRAPIGYVAIADNPVATNQGFKSFVPSEAVTADYLYYYMQFAKPIAKEMASGTTFLEISGAKAAQIPIPIAPLREQQEIVAEIEKQFTRLDAATAALKRVQANLKRYRASVLKAACEGCLAPTEAELARKEGRDYEPAEKLLQRILRERRARWETDTLAKMIAAGRCPNDDRWKQKYKEPSAPDTNSLPEPPEGWCWASADQICSQITDGEHIQPPYRASGKPLLTAKHVQDGRMDFRDFGLIDDESFAKARARCAPGEGDILVVSVGATTGRTGIVGKEPSFAIVRSVLLLRPIIVSRYLLTWAQSPFCQDWIGSASGSTAQAHFYINDAKRMPVALAPESEQLRITDERDRMLSVLDALQAALADKVKASASLRQAVLSSAFTGQLVPQDPADEPASALLERIRAERSASAASKPARRSRKEPIHA